MWPREDWGWHCYRTVLSKILRKPAYYSLFLPTSKFSPPTTTPHYTSSIRTKKAFPEKFAHSSISWWSFSRKRRTKIKMRDQGWCRRIAPGSPASSVYGVSHSIWAPMARGLRSEEHTSELQSL